MKISILNNGPYVIVPDTDSLLIDDKGNTQSIQANKKIALCRCGFSANKPFCDGEHKKNGFVSEVNLITEWKKRWI